MAANTKSKRRCKGKTLDLNTFLGEDPGFAVIQTRHIDWRDAMENEDLDGMAGCNKKDSIYMDGDRKCESRRKLQKTSKSYDDLTLQSSTVYHHNMLRDAFNIMGCTTDATELFFIRKMATAKSKATTELVCKISDDAEKTKSEFVEDSFILVKPSEGIISHRNLTADNADEFVISKQAVADHAIKDDVKVKKAMTETVCKIADDTKKVKLEFGNDSMLHNKAWITKHYKEMIDIAEELANKKQAAADNAIERAAKVEKAVKMVHKMVDDAKKAESKSRPTFAQKWANTLSCIENMIAVMDEQLISSRSTVDRLVKAADEAKSSLEMMRKNIDYLVKRTDIYRK